MDPLDAKMYEGPASRLWHPRLPHSVADDAHQTACVHQALLDVFGTVERPLLEDLRSATGWQGTGMPPAQALLLWLNGTVPHVAALVLARARHYARSPRGTASLEQDKTVARGTHGGWTTNAPKWFVAGCTISTQN